MTNERRKIYARLSDLSEDLPIVDVRAAVADLELDSPHFVLQQAIDGPFALTGLLINGASVLTRAIRSSKRSIAVPIDRLRPFEIRWSAVCFQNQPKCVGYWLEGTIPQRLEEKRNLVASETWVSKIHTVA